MDAVTNNRTRRPWVALLLSLWAPGIGHVYLGELRGGLTRFFFFALGFYLLLILWGTFIQSWIALVILLAGWLGVYWGVAFSAYLSAKRHPAEVSGRWFTRWYGLLGILVMLGLGVQPAVSAAAKYFVQAYKFPSGSMDQTLFAGDHILVTKTAYGLKVPFANRFFVRFQAPNRGDIIVFKFPEDERKDFVKRVIGLPGDVVEIRDKRLFLNGKEVPESYVQHVDAKDDVEKRDQFGPVQVPDGSYFVLGDNRDQSLDSRFWGFVSIEKIKGKVFLVYWSWDRNERMVRWDRIGLSR